ncbi:MAG: putative porin [Candidatus Omnitrophota bacterium]
MAKRVLACMVLAAGIAGSSACGFAGEVDILVQKLVDKGILTPGDAQQILTETKEEAKKELAKGESMSAPKWVQDIKLKGDFRLRYQHDRAKQAAATASQRDRARIRLRIGAETRLIDEFKVGFGIATGTTSDPRSTNMTLGDSFSFKDIILDYAYGQYDPDLSHYMQPLSLSMIGGKFPNPIWEPVDMLWDTDIRPEGVMANLGYKADNNLDFFMNNGFFVLDESGSDKGDPVMFVVQPGVNWKITDNIEFKGAVDNYFFNGVKDHAALDYTAGTNTVARLPNMNRQTSTAVYWYNYNSIAPKAEIGFIDPFKFAGFDTGVPYLSFFGEYINNWDRSSQDNGWAVGSRIGHKKVGDKGQWQLCYNYRFLERDAWLDIFPDSDFYSGKTNAKGNNVIFQYGVTKNSMLNFEYYDTMNMTRQTKSADSSRLPAQVIQADWIVKF